jgi:hypothetical protein
MQLRITKLAAGALALGALAFTACKKDEVRATLTPSNAPTLTASTNAVVLQQANSAQTAATFTWTPVKSLDWGNAEHPYAVSTSYVFQVDKKGNNFASPATFSAGTTSPTTITVGAFNDVLNSDLKLTPGTAADLEVRLAANYASNAAVYSPAVALKATPYLFVCTPPAGSSTWSIIGTAAVDWDTDVALKYNCNTNTFDVTRAFKGGEFKFRANNKWDLAYGSNGTSTTAGGPLVNAGSSNIALAAGTYTIKLDLNNMVYTITK